MKDTVCPLPAGSFPLGFPPSAIRRGGLGSARSWYQRSGSRTRNAGYAPYLDYASAHRPSRGGAVQSYLATDTCVARLRPEEDPRRATLSNELIPEHFRRCRACAGRRASTKAPPQVHERPTRAKIAYWNNQADPAQECRNMRQG